MSGPKLGRSIEEAKKEAKKQAYQDSRERNEVEGKFGAGKRKFTMDYIMAKLKETGESVIILNLLALNLEKRLRLLLYDFLARYFLSLKSS